MLFGDPGLRVTGAHNTRRCDCGTLSTHLQSLTWHAGESGYVPRLGYKTMQERNCQSCIHISAFPKVLLLDRLISLCGVGVVRLGRHFHKVPQVKEVTC